MAKDFIVIFTRTNARVLVNPPEMGIMLRDKSAIINPDLQFVKGVPPHFWKMEYGVVCPMNEQERKERTDFIEKVGIDNTIETALVVAKDKYPQMACRLNELEAEIARLKADNAVLGIKLKERDQTLDDCHKHIGSLAKELTDADELAASQGDLIEDKMNKIQSLLDHAVYYKMAVSVLICAVLVLLSFVWRAYAHG